MRQVILDTETTGLYVAEGHRIIEIGCIEVINRKITSNHYHQYINPQREVEAGALSVHGITNDFLSDKPTFSEVVGEFMEFVRDAEIIIHNATFDVEFLNAELSLMRHACKSFADHCSVVDSLAIARQLHVGQRNSLDALCKRYFVDNAHREYHGALLDAHLLARVYLAMTGGQATLFAEQENEDSKQQMQAMASDVSNVIRDLLVIKADDKELFEHEENLRLIAEKGRCLWLDENVTSL